MPVEDAWRAIEGLALPGASAFLWQGAGSYGGRHFRPFESVRKGEALVLRRTENASHIAWTQVLVTVRCRPVEGETEVSLDARAPYLWTGLALCAAAGAFLLMNGILGRTWAALLLGLACWGAGASLRVSVRRRLLGDVAFAHARIASALSQSA